MYTLVITLETPINGYWDGGAKQTFNWNIDKYASNKDFSKIGSWEANYFFTVKTGKTDKQTLSYGKRVLSTNLRKRGIKVSKFEYIEKAV